MKTRFFCLGLLILFWAGLAAAATSQFVFTTEQQTILPGEISGALTIQSQDASGNKTNTTETIDLEFSSTSSTGEFLNSSGNPASTVMAKNTANRTFYYRDSTMGTYTLTVRAVGRESGQSWQASQQIVVSDGSSGQSGQQESQSRQSSETETQAPATSAPKVEYSAKIIGGDKIVIVGSVVNLEGAIFDSVGKPIATDDFLWAFGDGTYARGRFASHIYNYPGNYVVFLNASVSAASFGDSITASVIPNEVKISEVKPGEGGWVEVVNDSDFKIDISYWAVSNGREAFYFPRNTFIDAKANLVISKEISGIKFPLSGSVFLLYPKGTIAGEFSYGGVLRSDESFHNINGAARIGIESPSSGKFVARVSLGGQNPAPVVSRQEVRLPSEGARDEKTEAANQTAAAGAAPFFGSSSFWFLSALVLGVLSAVGYFVVKRKSSF